MLGNSHGFTQRSCLVVHFSQQCIDLAKTRFDRAQPPQRGGQFPGFDAQLTRSELGESFLVGR